MIKEIDWLLNQVAVHNVALRLEQSIISIQEKAPHRTDLIGKMKDCQDSCNEAYIFLKKAEIETRIAQSRNFDLEVINLNLKTELEKVKEINARLLDNATL